LAGGIVAYLTCRDHNPPHINALSGEHEALTSLDSTFLAGEFTRRALAMVLEYLATHRIELIDNRIRAQ
jgi:hypothetical protein